MPSPLDWLESAYEGILRAFERGITHLVAALSRYAERLYRFARHMVVNTLHLLRLMVLLGALLLAVIYLASIGDELRRLAFHWSITIVGYVLIVLGFGGIGLIIAGMLGFFSPRPWDPKPSPEEEASRQRSVAPWFFFFAILDVLVVVGCSTLETNSQYICRSPVLASTQSLGRTIAQLASHLHPGSY